MKVTRKVQFKTKGICIGDWITVRRLLKAYGYGSEGNRQGKSFPV